VVVSFAVLAIFDIGVTAPLALADSTCGKFEQTTSSCPQATGTINDGGVDLSAGYESEGGNGADSSADGSDAGAQVIVDNVVPVDNLIPGAGPVPFATQNYTINCTPGSPCDPSLVVRISDLVNFKPAASTAGMEPSGWTLVGLPTNFFATASAHIRSGSLLGFPAEVRFTPAGYRWDYGDGSARNSTSGGAGWAQLGLPEFSETTTSHSFSDRATRVITLTVNYSAAYRFAGRGWRAVSGTLAVPADPLTAVVGDAQTVLVGRDCVRNPSGPGC
jgi:hypothetical protein